MRVALVHEFLTQLGGAERVLQCFHELFPDAPVHTLVYDERKTEGVFAGWDIRTSFLQKLPGGASHYKWYLPAMPRIMESFDFSGYDLVLSDASAFGKGVITMAPTRHICYCHTPTRYLWENMEEYVAAVPYPAIIKFLARTYLKTILRAWDLRAAARPDVLLANSQTVQARIKKYYGRAAEVVYPPVDTNYYRPADNLSRGDYFFTAARLEPYKKINLLIAAFNELGWPLKIAGGGTALVALKKMARPNIEFLGRVPDEILRRLYGQARAFVFPALEDAGIAVLEALSCSTPVIGLRAGGTAEFVRDGENGVLFANQTADDIAAAVKKFANLTFNPKKLRESVLRFDKAEFKKQILHHAHRH